MTQTTPGATNGTSSTEAVVSCWTKNWNGRLEVIDEVFASQVRNHNPLPGQAPGRDGQRQVIELFRRAFPDLFVTAHDVIVSGGAR